MKNGNYRFRDFLLEPAERRLSRNGQQIALTPKVFDTLVLLVEQAGHVVTKDELMRVIWPRGYVEDSNLTKHIWLIRRALGESETDASAIETVPKVGYRFVAPLVVDDPSSAPVAPASAAHPAATADTTLVSAVPEPPSATRVAPAPSLRLRGTLWLGVLVAALGLAAVGIVLYRGASEREHPRHAVAVLGFTSLSGNAKDAWVGPALAEMLGMELSASQNVEVVPNELMRNASRDLPAPSAGGYSKATLERLRQRLNVDYVISGSYLVTSASDDAPLRVDLALQDAASQAVLATLTRNSDLNNLISLAGETGNAVLVQLGIKSRDGRNPTATAKLRPPSIDVARRMGFALDALDHYDPARARDELLEAVAESPGYALAYTYLSRAWAALGYHEKALAAAEQAAARSADLPAEQRLEAQAVVSTSRNDWRQAGHQWNALVTLRPNDVDYRLHAIDAAIAAGTEAEARAGIAALRPLAAGDPRVDLASARLASAFDDPRGAEQAAATALREAKARDAAGLVAEAQVALAGARMHLKQDEAARSGLLEAIDLYRAIHNPHGEADARSGLAAALYHLNRRREAREEYQRSMAAYQGIGDLAGEASVYRSLCDMLWTTGDRDGAQTAARRGLEIGRETGDIPMQSWTLQALATIQNDDSASDEVLQDFREVVELNVRSGHQTAWPLANVADVQRLRGELEAAHATCEQALAQATRLTDPQFLVFSTFSCGLIASDQGNSAEARSRFNDVLHRAQAGGAQTYVWDSTMALAQLDLDEGHLTEACSGLVRARDGFAAGEERTGEADASALLAECEQARGNHDASAASLAHARELRQAITSRQEVYQVDILSARLAPTASQSIQRLQELVVDAKQRHFVGWALEAECAAWELAAAHGLAQAGALHGTLESDARRYGYGRILRRLNRPAA